MQNINNISLISDIILAIGTRIIIPLIVIVVISVIVTDMYNRIKK